jgi:hypothetical protein
VDWGIENVELFSKSLDSDALSVNAVRTDPTVDVAPIVPDLEAVTLPGFNQVDVLKPLYLAQNNVTDLNLVRAHWRNSA